MKVLTIATQKGGVGKTTTARTIATALGMKKSKVLVIDLDPQRNLTASTSLVDVKGNIYEVLEGKPIKECISTTDNGYDIVIGALELKLLENKLDITILKNALEPIKNKYDFVIIDTPPTLQRLTAMALLSANELITPSEVSLYGVQALQDLQLFIEEIKPLNKNLRFLGVLLVRTIGRSNVERDIREELEKYCKANKIHVFKQTIRQSQIMRECDLNQANLFEDYKKAKITEDYNNFIKELLKAIK